MHSVANEYDWADFRPTVRASIRVDPKVLATYTGSYESKDFNEVVLPLDTCHRGEYSNPRRSARPSESGRIGIEAVECFGCGLLIHGDHRRMIGRVHLQPDDVRGLPFEVGPSDCM
jgi:hypothetical protein